MVARALGYSTLAMFTLMALATAAALAMRPLSVLNGLGVALALAGAAVPVLLGYALFTAPDKHQRVEEIPAPEPEPVPLANLIEQHDREQREYRTLKTDYEAAREEWIAIAARQKEIDAAQARLADSRSAVHQSRAKLHRLRDAIAQQERST